MKTAEDWCDRFRELAQDLRRTDGDLPYLQTCALVGDVIRCALNEADAATVNRENRDSRAIALLRSKLIRIADLTKLPAEMLPTEGTER